MIVEPGLVEHPKFVQFKTMVGAMALEYLLRIWGHCQQNKRGQFWPGASGAYVEVVCTGRPGKGLIFQALKACRWLHERDGGIEVHDWHLHNASLIARWNRPPQTSGKTSAQTPVKPPAQNTTGQDRSGVDRSGSTGGDKKGESSGVAERRLRTQFAALQAEIKDLQARLDDLTAAEREELRKKRALLKAIQKKQAEGDF